MGGRTVIDQRNIYEPAAMRAAGLLYHCVGRPAPLNTELDGGAQTRAQSSREELAEAEVA